MELKEDKLTNLSKEERETLSRLLKSLKKEYGKITVELPDRIDDSVNSFSVRVTQPPANDGKRDSRRFSYSILNSMIVQLDYPFLEDIVIETETRTQADSNVTLELVFKREKTEIHTVRESDLPPSTSEDLFDEMCKENGSKKQITPAKTYVAMCRIATFVNRMAVEEYDAAVQIGDHAYRQMFNGIKSISFSHMNYLMKCYGNDIYCLSDIIFMPNGGHSKSHFRSGLIFQFTRPKK